MIFGNEKGITILSTVIGISLALFVIAAISGYAMHSLKEIRRIDTVMSMIGLETKVLAAFTNEKNFPSLAIKKALQQGDVANIPAFPIYDLEGQTLVTVPKPVTSSSQIQSGEQYFDDNLNPCSDWQEQNCQFKLEVSMEMVAGSVNPSLASGFPDWIPPGSHLANVSPFANWAFAYRIRLNPNLELRVRNLGTAHNESLKIADHYFPLPNSYVVIDDKLECEAGGFISGVDSQNGVAKCIYPSDMCTGGAPLAKQVSIRNGEIGVSCVGWKNIRCPTNYVVYDFRPALFDASDPQNAGLGRCVFLGKDSQPLGTHSACPEKYTLEGTDCILNLADKFKNIINSGTSL